MHPETYIGDVRYQFAVMAITANLNRHHAETTRRKVDPVHTLDNTYVALRAALHPAGINMGELTVNLKERRIEAGPYADLVQALADLKPVAYEEIDLCQVKTVIGEVGNIWPEGIRPTPQEAAQAELDAARKFIRQTSEGLSRLVYGRGINVARDFLNGVRADMNRQIDDAIAALPEHMKR